MFDSIFPKHWTTLQRLMWLKTNALARAVYETITGNPVTFSAKAAPLRQLEVAFSPVQSGSGDPSPDNVRPISGWDSLNVEQRGVNLWDGEWENGNISDSTGQNSGSSSSYFRAKNYCKMPPNTDLYWYSPLRSGNFRQYFYDKDFNYLGHRELGWNRVIPVTDYDWAKDIAYFRFRVAASYDDTYDSKISINYPTTVHEYVPYNSNGRSISITLGQTVYGGTLDVLTGVVTVTWAAVDMGSLNWGAHATAPNVFQTTRGSNPAWEKIPNGGVGKAICSRFIVVTSATGGVVAIDGSIALGTGSSVNIYAHDSTCADATEFTTAVTGQTLCYKLATPITIQLTPQEVSSLLGGNTMWSDANGDLTVTYAVDPATTPIVGKGKVGQAVI